MSKLKKPKQPPNVHVNVSYVFADPKEYTDEDKLDQVEHLLDGVPAKPIVKGIRIKFTQSQETTIQVNIEKPGTQLDKGDFIIPRDGSLMLSLD